jgi:hypothetical protein
MKGGCRPFHIDECDTEPSFSWSSTLRLNLAGVEAAHQMYCRIRLSHIWFVFNLNQRDSKLYKEYLPSSWSLLLKARHCRNDCIRVDPSTQQVSNGGQCVVIQTRNQSLGNRRDQLPLLRWWPRIFALGRIVL